MSVSPYYFLWNSKGENYLDILIEFRKVLDSLSDSAATFRATQRLGCPAVTILTHKTDLIHLCGSWIMPGWYAGGTKVKTRFVNPNYRYASEYGDVGVVCECGETIQREDRSVLYSEYHDEGCTEADREAVSKELQDLRLNRIVRGANLNLTKKEVATQFGTSHYSIDCVLSDYDTHWSELREVGRDRTAETIRRLYHEDGEIQSKIAEAFGVDSRTVRRYLNRDTPQTQVPTELAV